MALRIAWSAATWQLPVRTGSESNLPRAEKRKGMTPEERVSRELPLAAAGGLLLLVVGVALAAWRLPEWRPGPLPPRSFFAERFRQAAQRGGFQLEPGAPTIDLVTNDEDETGMAGEAANGAPAHSERDPTARAGSELRVAVAQPTVQPPGRQGPVRRLEIQLSPGGTPLGIKLITPGVQFNNAGIAPASEVERLVALLLRPGEKAGAVRRETHSGIEFYTVPIAGVNEHILAFTPVGGAVVVNRHHGGTSVDSTRTQRFDPGTLLLRSSRQIILFLVACGLFVALLSRRRLDLANASLLAFAALVVSAATLAQGDLSSGVLWGNGLSAVFSALWIALLWSAGESLLRSFEPQFVGTLDTLRLGRIGPRTGRALLFGLAIGAALAGAQLLVEVAAASLPNLWPETPSITLPAFSSSGGVIGAAIGLAGALILALALSARWLPGRWQAPAAALAAGVLAPPLHLHPLALEMAVGVALFYGLATLTRRWLGLAALLSAAVSASMLPLAVFALPRLTWLPGTFAVAAGTCVALLAAGLSGLRRPAQVEIDGIKPPAFVRRLEEERRLKYEMDLLARMQRGLLPQRLPILPGWDVAARSELATEAGGDLYDFLVDEGGELWVAAGDVAGHGYSCAIAHAMTTAALASLIVPGRAPSDVLHQVDRVLRRAGARRIFTSLALLRVDPLTGSALLGNAGHPFPFLLLVAEGAASEVELPSLPLGQGPAREYSDEPLHLPPGAILVFCSDGLFEAADMHGVQYGYDRPREILVAARGLGAEAIVEALMADWRAHIGPGAPPDDTTILVIKRAAAAAA
jgi:hypothetical protein